jgi:hypothetical protein
LRYLVQTLFQPCTIKVSIAANKACVVYLNVYDADLPNTYFMKRFRTYAAGDRNTLFVQMPITGNAAIVEVFSASVDEGKFTIEGVQKIGLARQIDVSNLRNENVKNFVPFAQRFSYNASVLDTFSNRNYVSDKGGFQIKYSPSITDNALTPARINKVTKVIEVSRAKFLPMTVPMRMCILCHEFSHLYLNQDMNNELEADLNGPIDLFGIRLSTIRRRRNISPNL